MVEGEQGGLEASGKLSGSSSSRDGGAHIAVTIMLILLKTTEGVHLCIRLSYGIRYENIDDQFFYRSSSCFVVKIQNSKIFVTCKYPPNVRGGLRELSVSQSLFAVPGPLNYCLHGFSHPSLSLFRGRLGSTAVHFMSTYPPNPDFPHIPKRPVTSAPLDEP